MLVRLSEIDFIDMLYGKTVGEFIEMSDDDYFILVHRAETVLRWLRNARTLRPVLVSVNIMKESA